MGGNKTRQLRPRNIATKANLDVLMVVDGSKAVTPADFLKEKQICNALSANLTGESQLGVIQFGTQAKKESPLTKNRDELDKKIEAMVQVGGNGNLIAALTLCAEEITLSKFPNNEKQLWVITDGRFEDVSNTALAAQKLKREKQVTIFAVGVGSFVTRPMLDKIASPGCSFVTDFDGALKVLKGNAHSKELSCQISAEIVLPNGLPIKLGEDAVLTIQIENVGKKPLPAQSRIIFKENTYFREKMAVIPEALHPGDDTEIKAKLAPKTRSNKSNLDAQLLALPSVIELLVFDPDNNEIACDCSGLFLNHEDFAGDIYSYIPLYGVPSANIITFGPPGAGKSSFVNSVCSALSDHIQMLNIAGATRDVVTSTLLQFPLNRMPGFEHLKFVLYDVPGVDGKNYQGDEMALMLFGLLPTDIDFKHNACSFSTVRGRRSTAKEEFNRRAHVVAFFVPQGSASDSNLMERLSKFYYKITVEHKRKAIVIISHADELYTDEDRDEVAGNVCQQLSIDSSSVFFLENYVDVKDKQFHIDKSVLRILLAMISRADDFLTFDRLNPSPSPFPISQFVDYEEPEEEEEEEPAPKTPAKGKAPASPSVSSVTKKVSQAAISPKQHQIQKWKFLEKLQEPLRSKVAQTLKDEEIDDDETLECMEDENWRALSFTMGEILKIKKALA